MWRVVHWGLSGYLNFDIKNWAQKGLDTGSLDVADHIITLHTVVSKPLKNISSKLLLITEVLCNAGDKLLHDRMDLNKLS